MDEWTLDEIKEVASHDHNNDGVWGNCTGIYPDYSVCDVSELAKQYLRLYQKNELIRKQLKKMGNTK